MTQNRQPTSPARQRAAASVAWSNGIRVGARVSVTPGGILAIGALVSSILLSTAALVRVAKRNSGPSNKIAKAGDRLPQ